MRQFNFAESLQKGILYLLKSDQDFFTQIVTLVKPEYFELPGHQKIFSIIVSHFEKYKELPKDDVILTEVKLSLKENERISDFEDELVYINSIDVNSIANKEYLLDLIEKFAKKQAMHLALASSISIVKANGNIEEIDQLIKRAIQTSRNVDFGHDYFHNFEDRWVRELNKEESLSFKTLLPSLDKSLESNGLSAKELAGVAAPFGKGKSLFLVNQAVRSMMQGLNVLYITLEMSEEKLSKRLDSIMTRIPQSQLQEKLNEVRYRLQKFKQAFPDGQLMLKEFPMDSISTNAIKALLHQLKNHKDFIPQVIIIDYLELLRSVRDEAAEYMRQEFVARELKNLAMEYNCVVWTATQVNRAGSQVPVITDKELADSYGKARPFELLISLNQTNEEYDNGKMRAYIVKNRNGKANATIPMKVNYGTLAMEEDLIDNVNS